MMDILATKGFTEERRRKLAVALADWFQENIGLPTEVLFYDIASKALGDLQARSVEAQKQAIIEDAARQKLWAAEHGMIYVKEYMQKYSIGEQELRTAIDTHRIKFDYPPGRSHSFWNCVIDDHPLTPNDRLQLANSVMLTANQASERLGVDRKTFDRLKKKHNLHPAELRRSRATEWPFAVYRLADADRLKA